MPGKGPCCQEQFCFRGGKCVCVWGGGGSSAASVQDLTLTTPREQNLDAHCCANLQCAGMWSSSS